MPMDLNDHHTHQLFSTNHQTSSSFSLSNSIIFDRDQDQGGSYYVESKHLQSEVEKIVPSNGSRGHPTKEKNDKRSDIKVRVWKKEDGSENSSTKWMPSKKRNTQSMMVSDQTAPDIKGVSNSKQIKYEGKNSPLLPQETDNNYSSLSNQSDITVRVCADCHTTKTPLWRSGPKGPKSLCNACGIRQRKARHAIAAATAANRSKNLVEAEKSQAKKGKKLHNKGMKCKTECAPQFKGKRKLNLEDAEKSQVKKGKKLHGKRMKCKTECAPQSERKPTPGAKIRKELGTYEDLTTSLSKSVDLQQVFPRDEKEAAILLMALSCGLLHGFPPDHFIS
ncbi:hypothetical protein Fmac_008419 [Flemingia macrophylla]|uniref:GATA-type domain-containing protein n=1 Tax=Flemingia macrophylla TaxID=520843 RepID=A0ABD1MXF4_9FABA